LLLARDFPVNCGIRVKKLILVWRKPRAAGIAEPDSVVFTELFRMAQKNIQDG
jgi:hypothetical protein